MKRLTSSELAGESRKRPRTRGTPVRDQSDMSDDEADTILPSQVLTQDEKSAVLGNEPIAVSNS